MMVCYTYFRMNKTLQKKTFLFFVRSFFTVINFKRREEGAMYSLLGFDQTYVCNDIFMKQIHFDFKCCFFDMAQNQF